MNKRVVLTILILVSLIPTAPVKAEPFTYFEYPTETWIIEKQDYFGQFLEWAFVPVEGQHGDKRVWKFTWTKREYIEIYNDTTGEPIAFYENPIPSIREYLNDTDFLKDKYEELKDLGGFKTQGDFVSDCRRLDKYPIVPEDKEEFTGLHTSIDILNHDQGWFLVSFKDKWKLGKKITIGFGSTITYNGGTNTITFTGGTEESPVDFWDLWNASNVNGWGVVHNNQNNDTQYQFDCKLTIGDGSINTYFTDKSKQITFIDGIVPSGWQKLVIINAKAYVYFGTLTDATSKSTKEGMQFISLESTYNDYWFFSRSDVEGKWYVYGGVFTSPRRILISGANRVYNARMEWASYTPSVANPDIFRLELASGEYGIREPLGTINEIFVDGQKYAIRTASDVNVEITNSIFVNNENLHRFNGGYDGMVNLTDCEVDEWTLNINGVNTGKLYRKYTFNVAVVDSLGVPIHYADISLTYSGQGAGSIGTWETPANGSIPEQTISKGFYNQTGGNTLYPYEPYNLTISAFGYDTESFTFNISDPTSWTIGLMESVTEVEINVGMELMLFAGLGVLATLGAFITTASIGVVAGGLGAMLWFFTAQWFIVERAGEASAVFSNVFLLLAALCVFLTLKNALGVYKEMTSKGGY